MNIFHKPILIKQDKTRRPKMKKLIVYPLLLLLAAASVVLTAVMTKTTTTNQEDKDKNNNKSHKRIFSSNIIGIKAKKVLKKLELSKLKAAKKKV